MKTPAEVSLRSRIQRSLTRAWARPALLALGVLILVAIVVSFSGHELERHIKSLESWVSQLGWPGILVFVGLVVAGTSLFLPESLFGVAAGVLFGLTWGTAAILAANILAAALQYVLARRLLREPIRRKLGTGKMSALIQHAASEGSFSLQCLLRLAPMSQTIISYSLGAAGIRFAPYMAAITAMLPSILVEVYLGHTGKHLALLGAGATHTGWRHDALLFAGLIAIATGVGLVSRAAYKNVLRKTNPSK